MYVCMYICMHVCMPEVAKHSCLKTYSQCILRSDSSTVEPSYFTQSTNKDSAWLLTMLQSAPTESEDSHTWALVQHAADYVDLHEIYM
jgi:hypothetical protein